MEQNDVKFTEDFSTGLETIQPLDENFDKFITRIKKYSPKKGDANQNRTTYILTSSGLIAVFEMAACTC